jgi:acetyltransferase-like isoleucine patch superfamily enzyme
MRKIFYLLQLLRPYQWIRSVLALGKRVRIAPSASLLGRGHSLRLGCGTKIGARSRLQATTAGAIQLGDNVWISSDVEMQTETQITVGHGTTIQRRCAINGSTRIGANCIFAPNVFVSSGTHPFREIPHLPIREQERRLSEDPGISLDNEVWIQDDCWLGTNAVVCPGVTIGKGSVIGANTVVTRDVEPYTIIAGTPGRPVGKRLEWKPPATLCADRDPDRVYVLSDSFYTSTQRGCSMAVVAEERPFHFALAPDALQKGIRVHYEATAEAILQVGGGRYKLEVGKKSLHLPGTALTSRNGYSLGEMAVVKSASHQLIWISRIEIYE